jgi:hypothetical protein
MAEAAFETGLADRVGVDQELAQAAPTHGPALDGPNGTVATARCPGVTATSGRALR